MWLHDSTTQQIPQKESVCTEFILHRDAKNLIAQRRKEKMNRLRPGEEEELEPGKRLKYCSIVTHFVPFTQVSFSFWYIFFIVNILNILVWQGSEPPPTLEEIGNGEFILSLIPIYLLFVLFIIKRFGKRFLCQNHWDCCEKIPKTTLRQKR